MRVLLGVGMAMLLAVPAMGAWAEDFNSYTNGDLKGQGGWGGNATGVFTVDNGKVTANGVNAAVSLSNFFPTVTSTDGVWDATIQLQKKSGQTGTSAIVDIFFELDGIPGGFSAGWRTGPIQARGRQGAWMPSGANKTGWQPLADESTGWTTFVIEFDTTADIIGYYYTPAGGAETWLFDSSVDLSGMTGISTVRMQTVATTATGQMVNMDNFGVTPEPTCLVLLGLGGLMFLRRRRYSR